jgi:hypothetical protein
MKYAPRILIALAVLFSGMALIPFVGLPAEAFSWQQFAGVYTDPALAIDHTQGAPGSFFTITGFNYPPEEDFDVLVNGVKIGEVTSDAAGGFSFLIDTNGADPGTYDVMVGTPTVRFWLIVGATLWPQEGEGTIFSLPAGIDLHYIYLPLIYKNLQAIP